MTLPSLTLLGEFPIASDIALGSTFCSPGGAELLRMLGESGILTLSPTDRANLKLYYTTTKPAHLLPIWSAHPSIHRLNVFTTTPPHNDLDHFCGPKSSAIPGYPPLHKSRYVRQDFLPHLDRLANDILTRDPNLIICLGSTALWALAGHTAIKNIRGTTLLSTHTVLDYKLIPTFHPTAITRDWSSRPTVIADLMKARHQSTFPDLRRPAREIYIEPTIDDIARFFADHVLGCDLLSVDIETAGQRITCIGFAPSPNLALVIPFDDSRTKTGCYWPTREVEHRVWNLIKGILENPSPPKLFQNGAYDIAFLLRAYGIRTMAAREDTMLLSHALQPESLKGLGYLGSVYSDERSWKHMRAKAETIKRDN